MKKNKKHRRFSNKQNGPNAENNINAVIYARSATIEQNDSLDSIQNQINKCEEYARRAGHNVVTRFTTAGKPSASLEVNRMIEFIKQSKNKIDFILVSSLDRFSRSGTEAIIIAEKLRKMNVKIIDTSTGEEGSSEATFQQNVMQIFAEYDESLLHAIRTKNGMIEKLLKGEWIGQPPLGYDSVIKNGHRNIVLNDAGRLLQEAFHIKASGQMSTKQIAYKMSNSGLKMSPERLGSIFKNPFYCGLISHALLNGEVVIGKHEKLIPFLVFIKINRL